jgi:hypothetical protein
MKIAKRLAAHLTSLEYIAYYKRLGLYIYIYLIRSALKRFAFLAHSLSPTINLSIAGPPGIHCALVANPGLSNLPRLREHLPKPDVVKIELSVLDPSSMSPQGNMDERTPLLSESPAARVIRSASISTLGDSDDWKSESTWIDLETNTEVLSGPSTGTETAKPDERSEAEKIADIYTRASETYASAAETYRRILAIKENTPGAYPRYCHATRGYIKLYEMKEYTYKTIATKHPHVISSKNMIEAKTRLRMAENGKAAAENKLRLLEPKRPLKASMPVAEKAREGQKVPTSGTNQVTETTMPIGEVKSLLLDLESRLEASMSTAELRSMLLDLNSRVDALARSVQETRHLEEKKEEAHLSDAEWLAGVKCRLREMNLRRAADKAAQLEEKIRLEDKMKEERVLEVKRLPETDMSTSEKARRVEEKKEDMPVVEIKRLAEITAPIPEKPRGKEENKKESSGLRKLVWNWVGRVIGVQETAKAKTG